MNEVKRKPKAEITITNKSPIEVAAELLKIGDENQIANLDKILDIQERYDAMQAKKAYMEAMTAFKANPPKIIKDRKVSYRAGTGTTSYNHATLANVTDTINKSLSEHGLTASWVTQQNNGTITVTCKITHVMGHSESTCLTASPDNSGSKNPIQAIGSTVTYLERYTLLALTGLATYEQDNDGGEPKEPQTASAKAMEIVDEAFQEFEKMHADLLADGFHYDKDKFVKAIYKHFSRLPNGKPSKKANIKKILDKVKPEEVIVEISKEQLFKE